MNSYIIGGAVLTCFLFGCCTSYLAGEKDRSMGWWFLMGLLLGPLALLTIGFAPPAREPLPGRTRECPTCGEIIKIQAQACKHCCRDVEPLEEGAA